MAASLPVTGYDDGGVPKQVDCDVIGLCAKRAIIEELADSMSQLCWNPESGRILTVRFTELVLSITIPTVSSQLLRPASPNACVQRANRSEPWLVRLNIRTGVRSHLPGPAQQRH